MIEIFTLFEVKIRMFYFSLSHTIFLFLIILMCLDKKKSVNLKKRKKGKKKTTKLITLKSVEEK